ncbi:conjugative transposon protein TraK [Fulvivirga maritima]|uniref:conjugative transposon protein TraK n=1 Tax=Fulvivirga maritima TaxID=2904247 RepID=UPI001F309C95|nr:conjugative transposon protein TraK [Fulvivirga maritima]UII29087.1 conjugative transposon protein TraK [Fulvivirga maritima]
MFKQLRNIDTAFQHLRLFTMIVVVGSVVLSSYSLYLSYERQKQADARIYILTQGKALEALASQRDANLPVEAKDHVRMFHQYFFTFDPDPDMIQGQVEKAMYLADHSAKAQHDNLKESRYYSQLISGNISQDIQMTDFEIDTDQYPYPFHYKGEQRIVRRTSIVYRSMTTQGYLREVARTEHNPHGFLIEQWEITENQNLRTESR